jgi:hypothetical protein
MIYLLVLREAVVQTSDASVAASHVPTSTAQHPDTLPVCLLPPSPQHTHRAASTLLRLRREAEASRNPAELMLHVGDLSYANGNPNIWDSFIEGLMPFAARLPYMIAVGNHEVRSHHC